METTNKRNKTDINPLETDMLEYKEENAKVQHRKKLKITLAIAITAMSILTILFLLQCLLMPKYMTEIKEGSLIEEYYKEETKHDVIFVGDCEVYENISPITLWEKHGITSYIRGSAQQLIWQSYYILEDTFLNEKPDIVIYNVQSMIYGEPQSEAYNRMTIDGMKLSSAKINSIKASMTEEESVISYIFPLIRYHSRWSDLKLEDFKYMFNKESVSHNGYLMQTAIRPMESLPAVKPLDDYTLPEISFEYLDKMAKLCKDNGSRLILVKSPSIYPHWYEEWDEQIKEYALENDLEYYNFLKSIDEIGIDWKKDTYDMGMHLNVYGAEKYSDYLGNILIENYGATNIFSHEEDEKLVNVWNEKVKRYEEEKIKSESKDSNADESTKKQFTLEEDKKARYNEHPHEGFYLKVKEIEIGVNCGAWLLDEIKAKGIDYKYYEAASCAYQGLDKIYTFDSFEVLVNTINGHDVIVLITLMDDLIKTSENLKIGDSVNKITEIYGKDGTLSGETYKYEKDKTYISIITKNGKISTISYS